jgi:dTMP kinase
MKFRGKFITFEGPEGSGKSTHTRLLCKYLKTKGKKIIYVREPGSTEIGEKIRRILLDVKNKKMSDICEMCLYMAARTQLIKELILPALKQGKIVISDRFLDATIAYQGYGGGLDIDLIKKIGRLSTCGIKPDLTILLDTETKKGLNQAGKVKDRIEKKSILYHKRVRRGYLKLAKKEPGRIKVVSQDVKIHKTQTRIRKLVDRTVKK